jgi:O-antigen ligase
MQNTKYQNIIQSLNYYFLLLFIFWLPLKDNYLPLILALWVVSWVLEGNFRSRLKNLEPKILYYALLVYFGVTTLWLLNRANLELSWFHVQEKLSMVFFPLFFAGINPIIRKNYKKLIFAFIAGNVVAILYCFAHAILTNLSVADGVYQLRTWIYDGQENDGFWYLVHLRSHIFSYSYLSVFKHPSYFSVYILFSVVALFYFIKTGEFKTWPGKMLAVAILFLLSFTNYLLQSRAGLIAFAGTISLVVVLELLAWNRKKSLFVLIALFLGGLAIGLASPDIRTSLKNKISLQNSPETGSEIRVQVWGASLEVIRENFWFGTGPANLTGKLVEKYQKLGIEAAESDQLNTHNQFLETFAGLGLIGFLSLVFIIAYGFYYSIRHKNQLLFFVMFILLVNFMFEAMMNRMAGILFMMLFISMFVFGKWQGAVHYGSK